MYFLRVWEKSYTSVENIPLHVWVNIFQNSERDALEHNLLTTEPREVSASDFDEN